MRDPPRETVDPRQRATPSIWTWASEPRGFCNEALAPDTTPSGRHPVVQTQSYNVICRFCLPWPHLQEELITSLSQEGGSALTPSGSGMSRDNPRLTKSPLSFSCPQCQLAMQYHSARRLPCVIGQIRALSPRTPRYDIMSLSRVAGLPEAGLPRC
ncbi:hypothetical protein CI238_08894 [Colletotrichum incanum]|uniref:Uncharacterized protein n=1 Tax=Colletotrichum incanum TaxID=1573173 RepID=A0A167A124_COLIC|nr:hypothetical protein CI238_08894 [Colletotrichum incanum]